MAASGTISACLSPTCSWITAKVTLSSWMLSGVTVPETTISPTPQDASTVILERSPLVGSRLMATPAVLALTIFCTTTAMHNPSSGISFLMR
ncbi:hypothetical protein D3C74_413200 [compost metagenome]